MYNFINNGNVGSGTTKGGNSMANGKISRRNYRLKTERVSWALQTLMTPVRMWDNGGISIRSQIIRLVPEIWKEARQASKNAGFRLLRRFSTGEVHMYSIKEGTTFSYHSEEWYQRAIDRKIADLQKRNGPAWAISSLHLLKECMRGDIVLTGAALRCFRMLVDEEVLLKEEFRGRKERYAYLSSVKVTKRQLWVLGDEEDEGGYADYVRRLSAIVAKHAAVLEGLSDAVREPLRAVLSKAGADLQGLPNTLKEPQLDANALGVFAEAIWFFRMRATMLRGTHFTKVTADPRFSEMAKASKATFLTPFSKMHKEVVTPGFLDDLWRVALLRTLMVVLPSGLELTKEGEETLNNLTAL